MANSHNWQGGQIHIAPTVYISALSHLTSASNKKQPGYSSQIIRMRFIGCNHEKEVKRNYKKYETDGMVEWSGDVSLSSY